MRDNINKAISVGNGLTYRTGMMKDYGDALNSIKYTLMRAIETDPSGKLYNELRTKLKKEFKGGFVSMSPDDREELEKYKKMDPKKIAADDSAYKKLRFWTQVTGYDEFAKIFLKATQARNK